MASPASLTFERVKARGRLYIILQPGSIKDGDAPLFTRSPLDSGTFLPFSLLLGANDTEDKDLLINRFEKIYLSNLILVDYLSGLGFMTEIGQ